MKPPKQAWISTASEQDTGTPSAHTGSLHDTSVATNTSRSIAADFLTPATSITSKITSKQKARERRCWLFIGALIGVMILLMLLSLTLGASNMNIVESLQALFGVGEAQNSMMVQSIRLPRIVCAFVAGAGLALAGAVLQSVLENPLASASTVGISQGAVFGATVAILVVIPTATGSITGLGMGTVAFCAFAGAMLSGLVVLLFSRLGIASPESIILVGVALSALWAGASTILQYFSTDLEVAHLVFWQFGNLGRATWAQIGLMALVGTACAIYFFANRWNYNALQNGSNAASSLGVPVQRTRILGVVVATLMAAIMVSFVGLINFIGLIAPHIARRIVGNDYRFLLPASLVLGVIIMLASDLLARMLISPVVLPIGAITSFLGAPLFLYLLYRGYRGYRGYRR